MNIHHKASSSIVWKIYDKWFLTDDQYDWDNPDSLQSFDNLDDLLDTVSTLLGEDVAADLQSYIERNQTN